MNEIGSLARYVGNELSNMVTNEEVKGIETESIITSYPQNMNESYSGNTAVDANDISKVGIKLNTEHTSKSSVGMHNTISTPGPTSSSNTVPGIEFLLHNDMSNTSMGSFGTVPNYVQLSNSEQGKFDKPMQHFQQIVNNKQVDKLSESVQSYQQFASNSIQPNKLSESSQNFQTLSDSLSSGNVEVSGLSYQHPGSSEHEKSEKSVQKYQLVAASNQHEKPNEPAHNLQPLIKSSLSNELSASIQNYHHLDKLGETDKSSESVHHFQELGKVPQAEKSGESISKYPQNDNTRQANDSGKSVKSYHQLDNSIKKLNESVSNMPQVSQTMNLNKCVNSVQQVDTNLLTTNANVRNYQQMVNSEQKLNESLQSYGQLLENCEQTDKISNSVQTFQSMENEGVTDTSSKSAPSDQQLESSAVNVKKEEVVQEYHQLGNSEQGGKLNDSVQHFQQVSNSEQVCQSSNVQKSNQTSLVSIVQTNTVNISSTLSSALSVSRGLAVPRKPVGIREPIVIREQVSTTSNVPGIEYLLHNNMRNPSVINPAYLRNSELFRNKQNHNNGSLVQNIESGNRREYKHDPMVSNIFNSHTNVTVVDRSGDMGSIGNRELSVPRKPVGIREPIVMRESITSPTSVPGIEYLLHNEVTSENVAKKVRPPKEERPFLCTTCGNKFRQQSHLQQHIRIHTNHRPYQCSFCEKAFKQKSQLNQHERIHTGEKPYKCAICEKAFAQAGQLYSHRKTHGLNINDIKSQRGTEKNPKKRGRRAKIEEMASPDVVSPPSVIYIMEPSHPRQPRPALHFQFPRPISDFRPHLFNNGDRYPSQKLPKIETVVSLGPRSRIPASSSPISTNASDNSSQLSHWKQDPSKGSDPGT